MKRINSTGSVYKMTDKPRRNPYVARVSMRDADGFLIRKIIGYYPTKKEALTALETFNVNPYNLNTSRCTFAQVFEMFIEEFSNHATTSTCKTYRCAFNGMTPLHDMQFLDIHHRDLQKFLDTCGKNVPTLQTMKNVLSKMYLFSVKNEICVRNAAEGLLIPSRAENPDARPHIPYTDDEISLLWSHSDDDLAAYQLMLIYSGCRIGEFTDLDLSDVDFEDHSFRIRQAKTKAGIRTVPIADKVFPLWQRLADPSRPGLLVGDSGNAIQYQAIMVLWQRLNKSLGIDHYAHDCRHTAVTRMTAAGIDSRIIKKVVGHKAIDVTVDVYTHADMDMMRKAVNSI